MAKPKSKTKVIIGMPCTETVKAKTAHAVGCLAIGNPDIIDFLMIQSCDLSSSRMWLVKEAKKRGATHLLFVDSDMVFPEDTLRRLLAANKDIIGVEYHKRKFPLQTVSAYMPDVEKSETEPFKVGIAGTGVMLIKLDIFDNPKMDKNWFSFGRNAEGENVIGEDGWFCNTARAAGYDIWVDPTIKVYHAGEYLY
jgi:hypothetical protein